MYASVLADLSRENNYWEHYGTLLRGPFHGNAASTSRTTKMKRPACGWYRTAGMQISTAPDA